MDDLTLVGVHDDGEHVVLAVAGGQQYLLRVDEALRAAVRRDRARLGQLQIENGGRLRPRDVQARIRAGQTAEEVAAETGVPVDYIHRYEGPVLAEREFVAQQAREIRSRHGVGPGPTLGEVVAERLVLREADDDASWDAWRTEEGAWVVVVSFTAGGKRRQAQWAYDAQLRHIAPLDDEARWFTEADPGPPGQAAARRLTSVPDGEVELTDVTAPEPEHPRPDADGHPVPVSTGPDLLDTLRERRGRRSPPVPPSEEDGAGPDPVREAIDSLLSRTPEREQVPDQRFEHRSEHRADHRPENRSDQRSERWSGARSGHGTEHRADVRPDPSHPGYGVLDPYFEPTEPTHRTRGGTGEPEVLVLPAADPLPGPGVRATGDDEPAGVPAGVGAPRAARKPRRASVPSWDDIVFGSRRD